LISTVAIMLDIASASKLPHVRIRAAALIFAFVFGVIAGLPSEGEPYLVFAFAGMTAWNTFANVLNRVSASLVANGHMLSKIYFPRLILSLSSVVSALVDSAFSLVLLFVMMAIYRVWPGWGIVLLPVWLLILVVLALGLGLMASSWMVRYRDVSHIIPVALNLGLFISPVAWSMTNTKLSERFLWVHRLNPLTSLLEACDGSVGSNGTGNSNNRTIGSCPSKLEGGDDFALGITRYRISFG